MGHCFGRHGRGWDVVDGGVDVCVAADGPACSANAESGFLLSLDAEAGRCDGTMGRL